MRITELLDPRSISLTGAPATKKEALDQMVELMVKSGKIRDKEAYRQQVYAREEESTRRRRRDCDPSWKRRFRYTTRPCGYGSKRWCGF